MAMRIVVNPAWVRAEYARGYVFANGELVETQMRFEKVGEQFVPVEQFILVNETHESKEHGI